MKFPSTIPVRLWCASLFCLVFALQTRAQSGPERRFKAAAVAGITASQIDGDLSAGYNKLGFQAGIRAVAVLGEKSDASIEFLFSQRGAQSALVSDPDEFFFSLTLNYVEVPVLWHYYDWAAQSKDGDEFYRASFDAGLSYARLIGSRVNDDLGSIAVVAPDLLDKNDLSFVLGASYYVSPRFGLSFRYSRSFGFMYNPKKHDPAPLEKGWNGHCLYFQSAFFF